MRKKTLSNIIYKAAFLLAAVAASGCDLIHDDLPPCPPPRAIRIPVTYTMNMAFADALPRQVESLSLYVADTDGNIISTVNRDIEQLSEDGYAFTPDLPTGKYIFLIWGSGTSPAQNPVAFNLSTSSRIPDIAATLPLKRNDGSLFSDQDIIPLFHAYAPEAEVPDGEGTITLPALNLTKDTNLIQVAVQSTDRSAIDPDNFTFSIEADNSSLSYLNEIIPSSPFVYQPWAVTPLSASYEDSEGEADAQTGKNIVNGILAEMSVGRLMEGDNVTLVVTRLSDQKQIIRINLIQYFLLVKGEYNRRMTNQEYLDRNDSYSLILFLDSTQDWDTRAGVFINGWRIVPPQSGNVG